MPDSIAETDRPHVGSTPHLAVSACRAYADGSSVGNEYDAWTNEGILEAYWGEHIHLGYYNEQVADADESKIAAHALQRSTLWMYGNAHPEGGSQ